MVNPAIATKSIGDEAQIQPKFQLRFENSASPAGRGFCLVDVMLKNGGSIAASFPFLCLTALGLHVAPAPGWTQEDVTLVRRMQRFTPLDNDTLDPGSEAHCCTISLRYKPAFGGCLEFEPGSEHLLADFPNLNLTCAVGAGNYPSSRMVLQVPATALRTIIEKQEKTAASHRDDDPGISQAS
jgi:hypothetical protein